METLWARQSDIFGYWSANIDRAEDYLHIRLRWARFKAGMVLGGLGRHTTQNPI